MTSQNPHIPNLPQEIRATVLNQYDTDDPDLLHLWTSIRFWRPNVNSNMAMLYSYESFIFLRLRPDGQNAVFSSGKPKEESVLQHPDMTSGTNSLVEPRHIVRVGGRTNDTPLPGLAVDVENGSLEVNWRQLFQIFFAEEKLYSKLLARNLSQSNPPLSRSAKPPGKPTPRPQMQEIPLNAPSFTTLTLSIPISSYRSIKASCTPLTPTILAPDRSRPRSCYGR
ncbi:MAG: hypothetical protein ALECFALPRED_006681 [Alectoria fallacina]|uniref:Uncharacterized protein n=1 Tax=Alectoria fallacina TaxID=1903189 RepID=A0A8H3EPU5_9LECA|nr:MAG: hypothetical protein ALECFALPRED_006681 [Alectoria fallacina]